MTVLFTAWGYDVTRLEFASVLLAFIGVGLGIVGTRWTWPFYFVSSLLYGWLFLSWHLPASAGMQVIFLVAAVWGWFTWGAGGAPTRPADDSQQVVARGWGGRGLAGAGSAAAADRRRRHLG